jgi:hypothetical protein
VWFPPHPGGLIVENVAQIDDTIVATARGEEMGFSDRTKKPITLLASLFWHWKSRNLGGRLPVRADLRALIWRMSVENVRWGAPRIQGELLKLRFAVAQSIVNRRQVHGPEQGSLRSALEYFAA